MNNSVQHVFLVGAKSLGAYGGYETFLDKLTQYHQDNNSIRYHVACKASGEGSMDENITEGVRGIVRGRKGQTLEFSYHNARCFKVSVPNIGPAQAIYYDAAALLSCCRYIKRNRVSNPIIYIMACRLGPLMPYFCRRIHALGGKVFINPDGHEWMRAKWNRFIRKYWKYSESIMVRHCDLAVCDSKNIEKYIHESYDGLCPGGGNPKTTYIAYGAEIPEKRGDEISPRLSNWLNSKSLSPENYYLIVGRFVPENNYETMIREFMASRTEKNLAIIANSNERLFEKLEEKLHFSNDSRIKFVGTVYDSRLLTEIRQNAYAYLHGHEVGGTNPSLLEALGATKLNLLLDVGFNSEVAEDAALYWSKQPGDLAKLINSCDKLSSESISALGNRAAERIRSSYSWSYIASRYENLFIK